MPLHNNPPITLSELANHGMKGLRPRKEKKTNAQTVIRPRPDHATIPGIRRLQEIAGLAEMPGSLSVELDDLILDETDLQVCCYAWAHSEGKQKDIRYQYLYGVQNESPRTRIYGSLLKMKGMKRGVSDLHLPVPSGRYHSLYIELKHGTNDLTRDQEAFLYGMTLCGHAVVVLNSFRQFQASTWEYLTSPESFVGGI